ncbi:MAG: hypothetical protein RIG63_05845 [Coleofasciculus chthonoplastes F3-SA18-01]|uniref:hypothetical protein n=1 Tax=Coleofasciculus chthonoplastes TaxID=64178 RepID=UPI0032F9CCF0
MTNDQEQFRVEYQTGKVAFEWGDYRAAVKHLEKACTLINRNSSVGGEAQMWLVTAYEAAGQQTDAIALGQQLTKHPDLDIRKQSTSLLYILQAPQLKRPEEWMTKIPDLGAISESDPRDRRGSGVTRSNPSLKKQIEPEAIDLSTVNTKDNQFIWVALVFIAALVGGLIWWGV